MELDRVFFDGSKFLKQGLMDEIAKEHVWAEVSRLSFKMFKYTDAILKKLLVCRTDLKIYKHSEPNLVLLQLVHRYLMMGCEITTAFLDLFFNVCCEHLQKSSNEKVIVLIDCRYDYFQKHNKNIHEILLITVSHLALLHSKYLFPCMQFYIVTDPTPSEKNILIQHVQFVLARVAQTRKVAINHDLDRELVKKMIVSKHKTSKVFVDDLY